MILEMARIQIWGMKPAMGRVVSLLHDFGKIQIDDVHEERRCDGPAANHHRRNAASA